MVDRVLLLVNTASGTGHPPSLVGRLRRVLEGSVGAARSEVVCVTDHPATARLAHDFVRRTAGPCALVVGGGNGTLRAAVEGIASALPERPGAARAVLAALRLGSGNLFARQFGVPADPEPALRGILENLRAGRLARCELVRCDVEDADGGRRTLHATSMVGFGSFGRVPGDIERWRRGHPRLRRVLARLLGLERLNGVEYAAAFALRALRDGRAGTAQRACRLVARGRAREADLVAGAVIKFGFEGLPLSLGLRAEQPAMALALLERPPLGALLRGLVSPARLARRVQLAFLSRGEPVRLERTGGAATEFFVDEDPAWFGRAVTLRLALSLPVAPGPDYRWSAAQEVVP